MARSRAEPVFLKEELAEGNEYVKAKGHAMHSATLLLPFTVSPCHPVQAVQDFAKETGDQVVLVSAQVEAFALAHTFSSEAACNCAFCKRSCCRLN